MLDEDEIIFVAKVSLPIDRNFEGTVKDIKHVLQVRVNMHGTLLACFEVDDRNLCDATSTLVG
jgi:hypothetical protein